MSARVIPRISSTRQWPGTTNVPQPAYGCRFARSKPLQHLFLVLCLMLLAACVSKQRSEVPIDETRKAAWEAEPACFLDFNECDADGQNCQLVRREYTGSDGVVHTWEACNTEYAAWIDRLRVASTLLKKRDPPPQCYKAGKKVLAAMGADPRDPDALLQLAERGMIIGTPACTDEWCAWMSRNFKPDRVLPNSCQAPSSRVWPANLFGDPYQCSVTGEQVESEYVESQSEDRWEWSMTIDRATVTAMEAAFMIDPSGGRVDMRKKELLCLVTRQLEAQGRCTKDWQYRLDGDAFRLLPDNRLLVSGSCPQRADRN